MPPFPINPSAIPMVRTRKALMIVDLQNDFLCREGALFTEDPENYVERILEVAKAFRDSGAGDVIWVRSEFESHRPLTEEGEQIITTDSMLRDRKTTSRGRQPTSTGHESAVMENDDEAFLSVGAKKDTRPCVRKGTKGAEFAPRVKAAIVPGRDIVFTKTHYSAFASGQQLVQMLRGRFVTQMYVCGALTNVSIYATALGAGQHGYGVTLVEDCCGFRSTMRHLNAVRQLDHLAGCDVIGSDSLLDELQPPTAPQNLSTGLSPSISKIALELGSGSPDSAPAAGSPPPPPAKPASPQRARDELKLTTPPRRRASNQSNSSSKGDRKRPSEDTGHLEAESDPSSSDRESTHRAEKKPREARGSSQPPKAKRSELKSSKGPTLSPGTGSTHAEKPRVVNRVKRRTPRTPSDKKPAPSSSATVATPDDASSNTAKREPRAPTTSSSPPRPLTPKQQPSPPNMTEQQTSAVCGEALCEGDTHVITNLLPPALAADGFERLLEEVSWAGMSHMGGEVPRRIAVQGAVADDGSMPVYRHPADESPPLLPFSPTVLQIKAEVEKHLGHPLNHVLIQHYRTGNDYISEHSDKTLDIAHGTFIANVSLGAERTMIFRTKRPPKTKPTTTSSPTKAAAAAAAPPPDNNESPQPQPPSTTTTTLPDSKDSKDSKESSADPPRQTHRAPLPHNSLLRMGLRTNTSWLHAIRQDKRSDRDRTPAERAHHGARISLTFRQIATFIDAEQGRIWGQGAVGKTKDKAGRVVNGLGEEAVRLVRAFGAENNRAGGSSKEGGFEWDEWYGGGFDVLHMGTPKRVFYSAAASSSEVGDHRRGGVGNVMVALALAELGVGCAKGSVEGAVKFEDNDPGRTAVEGEGVVLRYLDAVYGAGRRYDQMLPGEVAKRFTRLQRGLELSGKWAAALREVGVQVPVEEGDDEQQQHASGEEVKALAKLLEKELAEWDGWAKEAATGEGTVYITGGAQPGPADFALWPVLHDVARMCGEDVLGEHLKRYYTAFRERSSVAKALGQIKAE